MKKSKILFALPLAGMLLSGCTFQEGWDSVKTWVNDHVLSLFSKSAKEEKESGTTPSGQTPSGSDTTPSGSDTTPGGDTTPTETTVEASFTLSSADSVTKSGVTVTFAKGDGSSAPAWYSAGLRLYAKNTITFSSQTNMKKIEFDWEKQGTNDFASASASTGSYSHPSAAGKGTWTGSGKSVTFTLGTSGQLQLNTFKVTVVDDGNLPDDPVATYTVQSVAKDIGDILTEAAGQSMTLTEDDGVYGIALDMSEDGEDYSNTQAAESVLSPAAEALATYYMPEYLTVVGAQYYDTTDDYWDDGSGDTVYGIYLDVEDVEVEVIAYCYNDSLVGAIYVYSIAE